MHGSQQRQHYPAAAGPRRKEEQRGGELRAGQNHHKGQNRRNVYGYNTMKQSMTCVGKRILGVKYCNPVHIKWGKSGKMGEKWRLGEPMQR